MNNPNFKHRNAYAINREDNSAEFDLYDIAGNVVDSFIVDLEDVGYIANYKWCKSQYGVENHKVKKSCKVHCRSVYRRFKANSKRHPH